MSKLDQPVARLKGVGINLEAKLARLGIYSTRDLLSHYPRRYEDFSKVVPIRQLVSARPATVRGRINQVASRRARNRRLAITEAIISDHTGTIKAVWFNQPYLEKTIPTGTEVYVSGRLEFKNNDLSMLSPAIEVADTAETKNTARIVPIYPETAGLSSKQLRSLILPIAELADELPEVLPAEVLAACKLMPRPQAVREIHFPSSMLALSEARRRLAFEELFFLILASLVIKQEIKTETAPKINFKAEVAQAFVKQLGFELTDAQRQAAWRILQDMDNQQPMNRLLEGDVGSGKTVVAALAAVMALASGYQVGLMVPTDILARQHNSKLTTILDNLGYKTALVLGQQPAAERRVALDQIKSGAAGLVIGTHALLSGPVEFKQLGLVIIDEQHRFGVGQRQALKRKAAGLPHLLSMTATPIPRSLALTVYGDLDITVIDQLPPGRQPIATKVIKDSERHKTYVLIDQQIEQGRQVFVVCPLIEESDKLGAKSAIQESERLRATIFKHRRIDLLHGRMKPAEKAAVMEAFANGKIDILVSTNVIEVGIDVPNATIMLIEGAERFGLAALHQMRGRIGRGEHKSYCFVVYDQLASGAQQRLAALERTADGFRLAQIDLELRGPGQIYGVRQHGVLDLELADLADTRLLASVRQAAAEFLQKPSAMIRYPYIVERVNALKSVTSLD